MHKLFYKKYSRTTLVVCLFVTATRLDLYSIFSLRMEMSRLTRDGTAEPVSRDQILRHARGQGNTNFPVQLTTSRIGNLTRLIHTLLYVMTIHILILIVSLSVWRMSRLTRDGTAEPVSRDQFLRRLRGQGNVYFPCSADHLRIGNLIRLIHTLLPLPGTCYHFILNTQALVRVDKQYNT